MYNRVSIYKLFLFYFWFVVRTLFVCSCSYVPFVIYSVSTIHSLTLAHTHTAPSISVRIETSRERNGERKKDHLIRVRIKWEKIIPRSIYLPLGFVHSIFSSFDIIPLTTERTRKNALHKPVLDTKLHYLHPDELSLRAIIINIELESRAERCNA